MPSLLEAIDKKYGKEENENCDLGLPIAIYVPKKSPRNSIPSLLVLNDCDIETAGDEQELEKKCQGVEELDLAQNKLARWTEVFDILKHMPRVKFVNLSFNNLAEELVTVDNRNPFPYLKNLVLNSTNINWKSVQDLLLLLPSLEELHLSLNNYSNIDLGEDINCRPNYQNVKKVHFTGNPVSTWREICKLGLAFPTLESLVLAECPLQSLDTANRDTLDPDGRTESECESNSSPGIDSPHSCFRKLKFLNLNSTLLATWDDVERLSRFPALQCLRLQGCPLFEVMSINS
ncbi:Tubulin-specific chaperone cofactor E-like protein [Blattella germanica]|nr:Tubulin-specific chaperone cofactor E-like protein [Blattella germanica]